MLGELHFIPQDVAERSIPVLALKWCRAVQHLVDQDTKRPPIDCASVSATLDDFGCNVFFRTDKRVGPEVSNA